jgi:hypothetical protein
VVYMTLAFVDPIREVNILGRKLLADCPWSPFEDYRIELVGDTATCSATLSYGSCQWMARLEIIGEREILLLDLEAMSLVRYRRPALRPRAIGRSVLRECRDLWRGVASAGARYLSGSLRSTHDFLIGGFTESLLRGTEPPVPASQGRESVRVLALLVQQLESAGLPGGQGLSAHPGLEPR